MILNTDGSTSTGTPVFAIQTNPASFTLTGPQGPTGTVATVNQSTGVVTAVARGYARISGMVENFTGSTLETFSGSNCYSVQTASGPALQPSMAGWLINIISGTGSIPGVYVLASVDSSGVGEIYNLSGALTCPAAPSSSGIVFATGPTRTGSVFVWPTNTTPCFGSNGAVYSSYNSSCFVIHEMFLSAALLYADPPFSSGPAAFFNSSGVNTFESDIAYTALTGSESSGGQSAWAAAEAAYAANLEGYTAGYSNLGWWCTASSFTQSSQNLYGAVAGPASQWTIPAPQIAYSTWSDYSNMRGCSMHDEVTGAWNRFPLQGPLTIGASSQSSISSIVASGGTCTVNGPGGAFPLAINSAHKFLFTGSSIANLTSVYPNYYTASSFLPAGGPYTSFTFPCAGVANGTYTSDTGQLQPYATGWQANTSTGFAPVTSFATIANQWAASGATFGLGWPPAGDAYCEPGWWGNTAFPGAQTIGGVNQVAQFADVYAPNGTSTYLIQRRSANAIVNASLYTGWTQRVMYGCYNPQLPLVMISTGVAVGAGDNGYGLTPHTVPVASASGNTITFSSAHGINNIIPGMTRLSITGATDSGGAVDTTNSTINGGTPADTYAFYVLSAPTPTTLTVAMSFPDFSVAGLGGTATFSNGNTATINSLGGEGFLAINRQTCQFGLCGSKMSATTTTNTRNYGYTFTLTTPPSGTVTTNAQCIGSPCNLTRTFIELPENLTPTASTTSFWREIPILASTGGTASIVTDNNYVKGRNNAPAYDDTNPDWVAGEEFEAEIMRVTATRIYQGNPAISGYNPASGFGSLVYPSQVTDFGDTGIA
ncbi:MAG: hypothetical protein ABSH31_16005, partial [Bryobacteraceae bacterium]